MNYLSILFSFFLPKKFARYLLNYLNIVVATKHNIRVPLIGGDGVQLLYHDRYEPWMRAFFTEVNNNHRSDERIVLIDMGANIGQTLISAKSSIDNLFYVGVEPNPRCLSYLLKLRVVNNWNECYFISAPCASHLELVPLYLDSSNTSPGASLFSNLRSDNNSAVYSVPTSFAKIVHRFNLASNDFIILKIDVEGSEYDILKSIPSDLLADLRPIIVVEVLPHVLEHQHEQLRMWSYLNNYSIYHINTQSYPIFEYEKVFSFIHSSSYSESESNYLLVSADCPNKLSEIAFLRASCNAQSEAR